VSNTCRALASLLNKRGGFCELTRYLFCNLSDCNGSRLLSFTN
jgi:hypothetical protein